MLIEFFGKNFGCFRDEFRLSMLATDIDPNSDRGIIEVPLEGEEEPLRLLRCAAIYGPNASGKSRVLRAARAFRYLLGASGGFQSDRPIAPYEPFLLQEKSRQAPVTLGLRAVVERKVYEYRIEFDEKRFVLEALSELGPDETSIKFERSGQEVSGPWTDDQQFALLSASFRPNALLLSLADRLAPNLANGLAVGFRRLLNFHDSSASMTPFFGGLREAAARRAHQDRRFAAWMLPWLKSADLGIVDYKVQEVDLPVVDEDEGEPDETPKQRRTQRDYVLNFVHGDSRSASTLPYPLESMGTRKLVGIAPYIYDLTHGKQNRACFIDEIGASLHPELLKILIRHFNCDITPQSVKGQLIFAAHETALIEGEARDAVLRRDQVYFTDKDSDGASRLYSLVEFKERQNLNMRRRYLQGRYGALPAPGSFGD